MTPGSALVVYAPDGDLHMSMRVEDEDGTSTVRFYDDGAEYRVSPSIARAIARRAAEGKRL